MGDKTLSSEQLPEYGNSPVLFECLISSEQLPEYGNSPISLYKLLIFWKDVLHGNISYYICIFFLALPTSTFTKQHRGDKTLSSEQLPEYDNSSVLWTLLRSLQIISRKMNIFKAINCISMYRVNCTIACLGIPNGIIGFTHLISCTLVWRSEQGHH